VLCINWQGHDFGGRDTLASNTRTDRAGRGDIAAGGIAAGSLHARSAAVQNRFGQPKTVLHVWYKFKDNVRLRTGKGHQRIKDMAGKIPGIRSWLKTARNQIRIRGVMHRVHERGSVPTTRRAGA